MAKSKKATPSRTSTKTKPTNSTNKNRTVTKSEVATAKKIVKQQLAPPSSLEEKKATTIKNLEADQTIKRLQQYDPTPKQATRPPKFEDFKPIGSLVPFRSFLPEGYVVFINVNCITSVQNYTTHTDSVQIGLSSGTTQLVKHSLSEVLSIISENK